MEADKATEGKDVEKDMDGRKSPCTENDNVKIKGFLKIVLD